MGGPTSVTLDNFVGITQRVIARDGFEGYLPTALYPARKHVVVLEDVPEGADMEAVSTCSPKMSHSGCESSG